jgi:hypothetical protein
MSRAAKLIRAIVRTTERYHRGYTSRATYNAHLRHLWALIGEELQEVRG